MLPPPTETLQSFKDRGYIMGLFSFDDKKMSSPVLLKDDNAAEITLEKLKELQTQLNAEGKALIAQDITNVEYGIEGENKIEFELKNSHMPMYIIHDLYISDGELNAQIDYLVVTRKCDFIIECKNLYGNIEINSNGDFIRTVNYANGRYKREGIYSPVTQSIRHLDLLKDLHKNRQRAFLESKDETYFTNRLRPVVVLANPKTILNDKYAKKDLKEKVIRADHLIEYIRSECAKATSVESNDAQLKNRADWYMSLDRDSQTDYTAKYESYKKSTTQERPTQKTQTYQKPYVNKAKSIDKDSLTAELKRLRMSIATKENIKAYMVFNDATMEDLISKMPKNKAELSECMGFGQFKANKYGDQIIFILNKYR